MGDARMGSTGKASAMTADKTGLRLCQKVQSRYDWYVVAMLFAVSVLGYIDRVILSFLVEPVKAELALSDAQIGAVTGLAFAALYVFGGIFIGRMIDKGRRVLILTVCIVIWSLATGATGIATGFVTLFIARMFVGIGEAGLSPAAIGIISNRFAATRVQKPISLFTTGLYVGGGLAMILGGQLLLAFAAGGPYVLPLIGEAAPWRLVFIILAVPGLLLSLLLILTVRDKQSADDALPDRPAQGDLISGMEFARKNRALMVLLIAAVVTWSMNNYGLLNWYPAMLMRSYEMAPMLVANTYGPAFLFGGIAGCIAVSPATGFLRKHYAERAPFMLCVFTMGLLAVATISGPLMPNVTSAVVMAFVTIFVSATSVTSVFVLLVAVIPQHLRGLYTGLYLALVNLTGGAFGSVFVGLFTDHIFGSESLNLSISLLALLFGPIACYLMLKASRLPVHSE
jgi:MFS family permease